MYKIQTFILKHQLSQICICLQNTVYCIAQYGGYSVSIVIIYLWKWRHPVTLFLYFVDNFCVDLKNENIHFHKSKKEKWNLTAKFDISTPINSTKSFEIC